MKTSVELEDILKDRIVVMVVIIVIIVGALVFVSVMIIVIINAVAVIREAALAKPVPRFLVIQPCL